MGVAGVFRELVRSGGVGVLFQGATARVLWLMAFTTVYLQVYEMLTREIDAPSLAHLRMYERVLTCWLRVRAPEELTGFGQSCHECNRVHQPRLTSHTLECHHGHCKVFASS